MTEVERTNKKSAADEKAGAPESGFIHKYRAHLIVLLVFAVAGFILLLPITVCFKSRLVGHIGTGEGDYLVALPEKFALYPGHLYGLYLKDGFTLKGLINFTSDFFLFPVSEGIGSFAPFILFLFFRKIFPFPAYYNLYLVLVFILNGYCFYLLGDYLYKNRSVAAAAGFLFSTSPYLLKMMGVLKIEQFNMFCIPLFVLFFHKTFTEEKDNLKKACISGVFWALTSLFYWYYGMFAGFFAVLYLICFAVKNLKNRHKLKLSALFLVSFLVCFILVFPFAMPYIKHLSGRNVIPDLPVGKSFPAPPAAEHPVNMRVLEHSVSPGDIFNINIEYFIPVTITILAVISFFYIKKIPFIWYLSLIFFYLLSMGPFLKIGQKFVNPPIKLLIYDFLYASIPFFRRFQWPDRILSFVLIFMLILAGYTVTEISKKLKGKASIVPVAVFIILIPANLAFSYGRGYYPIRTSGFFVPQIYKEVAAESVKEKRQVRIMHLPITGKEAERPGEIVVSIYDDFNRDMIFYTMMSYMQSYEDYDQFSSNTFLFHCRNSNSVIKALWGIPKETNTENVTKNDKKALQEQGYEYAVVHESFFYPPYNSWGPGVEFDEYIRRVKSIFGEPVRIDTEFRNFPLMMKRSRDKSHEKFRLFIFKTDKRKVEDKADRKKEF